MDWHDGIFGRAWRFACLLIAIGMIAVPPSVSHAASDMHGDRQGVAATPPHDCPHHLDKASGSDRKGDAHAHRAESSHAQSADDCCDGICQPAVMDMPTGHAVGDAERRAFRLQDDQSASIRSVVLIRPPRT